MAIQDILNGEGLGIVDPHGGFAEKMLDFVPESRINDVVYFAPHDIDWPVAFNVMENVDPTQRHLVAAGLLGVFKKIWPDVWSPRMEYILNNCILALLEYPNSTLLGINRMLSDKEYRKEVVSKIKDPVIKAFWVEEFAKYTDRFMTEAGAAIQNKVGQFISNPLIRNIIGQTKSAFDIRDIMDQKKIFIMNLSKGRVGEENSRLIGAMLITKIYLAAMSRVDVSEEQRPDFYLYVDEFQNFATESFKDILSEARKYRLNLILAHQYIAQMDESVSDAVFGNMGTMINFRVGATDAEMLEKELSPEFYLQDIVNLGFAEIYLKLMIDGVASRPFSARTLFPMKCTEESHTEKIIESSRDKYATARHDVEEQIAQWHAPIVAEKSSFDGEASKGVIRSIPHAGDSKPQL
ncbi:MAG: TraM recognition domain-containing protein, partial [Nanoarchaeota archaeon]